MKRGMAILLRRKEKKLASGGHKKNRRKRKEVDWRVKSWQTGGEERKELKGDFRASKR